MGKSKTQEPATVEPPQPVDVIDGIPNRSAHRPLWKYLLVAAAFLAWCGILVTLFLLGRP